MIHSRLRVAASCSSIAGDIVFLSHYRMASILPLPRIYIVPLGVAFTIGGLQVIVILLDIYLIVHLLHVLLDTRLVCDKFRLTGQCLRLTSDELLSIPVMYRVCAD